ncbi:TonB-dependent receptor [Sphingomonas sp. LH128]|uniref:TonB-dependent receptor n=1 Tax=Sphingomonas sp. LH128 TaxID=473781 RepID=UPI00027CAB57|nr:TonB-dependent receptor [Sphingomonas sp. LH128]EJU11595.1 TonB-dependent receptor [Sphingomonas sp. LH128]
MRKTSLIIAGLMASASPVLAEEAPIVVTAPGGAIDLDEAREIDPQALDIAGKRDLARALERTVPGLTLAESTGNPWQAAITWRGFSASALQGAEQGMAVYLDGVRFNQPFGDVVLLDVVPEMALANAQLNDANPVLGRNALAGSLLLTTHDGVSLSGLRLQADVDTLGSVGGSASLGLGDKADNLLIVAEARHDDGWRVASPSTLKRVFAKGVHDAGAWGIEVQGLAADTDLTGNGVAPVELLAAKWNAVFTTPDVTHTRFARLVAAPWIAAGETGRIELRTHWQTLTRKSANGDLADFGACEDDAGYLCLGDDDEFEEPLLANGARVVNDPAVDDYAVFNRGRERTRSGGAMLQWLDERETENGTRRFAVGASWERARTRFTATTELGELEEDRSVEGLGLLLTSEEGGITPVDVVTRMSDLALFASAEVPLTPALTVEAGARWSRNTVRLDDRLGDALDGSHRFSRLNPSIEFDYALGADVHATAGFALTSRNPTPAELSCADPESPCTLANFFIADPPLKAMTARNWHAGLSGGANAFGAALTWRVNGWRSDTRNDIRMIASEVRGRAYFANLGESRRQGIEASADWRQGGWRLSGSYAFTDAKFWQDFAVSSPSNPEADEDGLVEVQRGDRLPGVPRHSVNLYAGRAGKGWELGFAMRARSGQVLVGDEGNDNAKTPAYAVFDMMGRVEVAPGIELAAELRNMFDRHYVTMGTFSEIDEIELAEAPGADNPRAYAPGAPRRLTVSVRARF